MQPLRRINRATSLALSLTLSLPYPALALRPQPDLAGLEEALHPESDIVESDGEETPVLRPSKKRNRVKKIAEALTWEELWSAYRQGRLAVPTPKSLSGVKMSDGKQGFFLRVPETGVLIPWYALIGDRAIGGFRLVSGLDRKPVRFLRVFQPVHGDITQAVVALHDREDPDHWQKLGTFGRERSGKPMEWSGIWIGMSANALGVLIRPTGAEPAFITDSLNLKPVSAQTARTLITHTAGLEELPAEFLQYQRDLARKVNDAGYFRVRLNDKGFLQELRFPAADPPGAPGLLARSPHLSAWVLLAHDFQSLLVLNVATGALEHLSATSVTIARLHPENPPSEGEAWVALQEEIRGFLSLIAQSGGISNFLLEWPRPPAPGEEPLFTGKAFIRLAKDPGEVRVVISRSGWMASHLPPAQTSESKQADTGDAFHSALGALLSPDSNQRVSAAEFLGQLGDPAAVRLLIKTFGSDKSWNARLTAALALGNLRDAKAVRPLSYALLNPDEAEPVRSGAAWALAQIGGPGASYFLLEAARSKDLPPHVFDNVLKALAQLREPRAIPLAADILRKADMAHPEVLKTAARVLATIDGRYRFLSALKPHVLEGILMIRPEWAGSPPASAEVNALLERVAMLPPSGGKALVDRAQPQDPSFSYPEPLGPTLTAEQQAKKALGMLEPLKEGDALVHQSTVQGRLSDDFKYVAVALILSSPYRHNWRNPLFSAPWGKVAPLVHDGGAVELGFNRRWSRVQGRTDFLQRVVFPYGPDQPEHRQMERDRLFLEARAYQRLALALHAALGTAPKEEKIPGGLPADLREKLAKRWQEFRVQMHAHLAQFDQTGPVQVPWFLENPRPVDGWPGLRYEAPWKPIRRKLLNLNRFAEKHPRLYDALRLQVVALLKRATDDIDRDLGLLPPAPPPAPEPAGPEETEAGLEEFAKVAGTLERVARTFSAEAAVADKATVLGEQLRPLSRNQRIFVHQWLWIHSFPKKAGELESLQPPQSAEALEILGRLERLLSGALETFQTAPKVPGTQIRVVKDREITASDLRTLEKALARARATSPRLHAQILKRTRVIGLFKLDAMDASVFVGPFGFTGVTWPDPWKSFIRDPIDDSASRLIWGSSLHAWRSKHKETDLVRDIRFEFHKGLRYHNVTVVWPREKTTAYRYLQEVSLDLATSSFATRRARQMRNHPTNRLRRGRLRDDLDEIAQRLNRLSSPEGQAALTETGQALAKQLHQRLQHLVRRSMSLWLRDLMDKDTEGRVHTLRMLGQTGLPEIQPIFTKALQDTEDGVRVAAAEFVSNTRDPRWIPVLLDLLWDRSKEVRAGATLSLVRYQPDLGGLPEPLVRALLTTHPEWVTDGPPLKELQRLRNAVAWLPPIGAKIPVVRGRRDLPFSDGILPATWTAEEQVRMILRFLRGGQLGKEFIHQLTVQGRLPDEFKYVALALLLSSPYRHDWRKPFFQAPWGKVAPLVHDGGNVETLLNSLWKEVQGRTDFLQRVAVVYGSNRPELEAMERDRLLLETKAYQRLALALHAATGTAPTADRVPNGIPAELNEKLAGHWRTFRQTLDSFLTEFSAAGPVQVPWFLDQPRKLNGWDRSRHEADWDPIRKELLLLNAFAHREPQLYDALRLQVVALLKRATDDIDRDLGLLPPAQPPTPEPAGPTETAAGLEERTSRERHPAGDGNEGLERKRGSVSERGGGVAELASRPTRQPDRETRQTTPLRTEPTNQIPLHIPPLAIQGQREHHQHNIQPQSDEKRATPEILTQHAPQDEPPKHRIAGVNGDLQQRVALLGGQLQHRLSIQKPTILSESPQAPAAGMEESLPEDDLYMRLALEDAYRAFDDPAKLAIAFENMAHDDPGVRESAADLLGTVKDPQALSLLVRMLQDKDWRVRRVVLRALESLGWQPSTPQEKVLLHVTKQQWKELVGFDPDLIFAELGGSLETDPGRVEILQAAGLIRDARAFPILLKALQEDDSLLHRDAAAALDEIGWQPTSEVERASYLVAKERWEEAMAAGPEGLPVVIRAAIRERRGDLLERILMRLHTALDSSSMPPAQALSLTLELLRGALPLPFARRGNAYGTTAAAKAILARYTRRHPSFGAHPPSGDYQDPEARPLRAPILRRLAHLLFKRLESSPEGFSEILRQLQELDPTANDLLAKSRVLPYLSRMAHLFHLEWAEAPPRWEQIRRFERALSYLPPMGGKIPVVRPSREPAPPAVTLLGAVRMPLAGMHSILRPSRAAEEQIQTVRALHKSGALGAEYVHQLTVQGRLPDDFKYVALALILSSPYRQDWNEPFFEAHWGKVAPLIHDGGNAPVGLNRLWRKARGRTDFLQRVVVVYGKDKPELEGMEQDRLLLEAKAYQRLALALHAAKGTAPARTGKKRDGIPPDLYRKLAGRWEEFRTLMETFLTEFNVAGPVRLPWFLEKPRAVPNWGDRRLEADWPPIQKELLKLNQFALEQPQLYDHLRLQVVALLKRATDDIDRDLGLLPPAPPPAPEPAGPEETEAGLEEMPSLINQAGATSVRIVLGPSAVEQVPGLREVAAALMQAGLEEQFILLPEPRLPPEELHDQLLGSAARALGAGSLIGYAAKDDRVMGRFEELLRPEGLSVSRREPAALKLLVLQILKDLGVPPATATQETVDRLLALSGLEEAV